MERRNFEVLSFDCYGTLVDWDAGLLNQLKRFAPDTNDDDLLQLYAGIEAELEHANPTMLYSDLITAAVTKLGEDLGKDVSEALAADIGGSVGSWPVFPDSVASLAKLKEHFKLVVLSNVDIKSFSGSAALLGDPFFAVLTAEEIGSYKPSLQNFEALTAYVESIGGTGKHLHVAQSLFHDHKPAKEIGLPTAWINRRGKKSGEGASGPALDVKPDWEFPDMESFTAAILDGR